MNDLAISQKKNYNKTLDVSIESCLKTYTDIIKLFMKHYKDNETEKKLEYDNTIFETGLQTLDNIFLFLLLKTKNLKLVSHNCEKTVFYYFEFIHQIKTPRNDVQSILNLNINDAKIFVYKKTIYELLDVKWENSTKDDAIFIKLKKFTIVYVRMSFLLLLKHANLSTKELWLDFQFCDKLINESFLTLLLEYDSKQPIDEHVDTLIKCTSFDEFCDKLQILL